MGFDTKDELNEEGMNLWNNLGNLDYMDKLLNGNKTIEIKGRKKKAKKSTLSIASEVEMTKLIENSRQVVRDCKLQIAHYTAKEQYFKANECKVASTIHSNFIKRLTNILEGRDAFYEPIELVDDEDTKLSKTLIQ